MVLFMAYVINCVEQVKQKTEKIKIIVRAAEKYLGVKDVSWVQVNRKLEKDSSQVKKINRMSYVFKKPGLGLH